MKRWNEQKTSRQDREVFSWYTGIRDAGLPGKRRYPRTAVLGTVVPKTDLDLVGQAVAALGGDESYEKFWSLVSRGTRPGRAVRQALKAQSLTDGAVQAILEGAAPTALQKGALTIVSGVSLLMLSSTTLESLQSGSNVHAHTRKFGSCMRPEWAGGQYAWHWYVQAGGIAVVHVDEKGENLLGRVAAIPVRRSVEPGTIVPQEAYDSLLWGRPYGTLDKVTVGQRRDIIFEVSKDLGLRCLDSWLCQEENERVRTCSFEPVGDISPSLGDCALKVARFGSKVALTAAYYQEIVRGL